MPNRGPSSIKRRLLIKTQHNSPCDLPLSSSTWHRPHASARLLLSWVAAAPPLLGAACLCTAAPSCAAFLPPSSSFYFFSSKTLSKFDQPTQSSSSNLNQKSCSASPGLIPSCAAPRYRRPAPTAAAISFLLLPHL